MASRADLLFKRSIIISNAAVKASSAGNADLTIFPAGTRTSSMNERLQKVVDALGLTDAFRNATNLASIMQAPIHLNGNIYEVIPGNNATGAANLVGGRAAEYGNLIIKIKEQFENSYYEATNDSQTMKDAYDQAWKITKAICENHMKKIQQNGGKPFICFRFL